MTYSSKHQLYFVLATDFKLHVFNENLIKVGDSIPSRTRLVHYCEFYEQEQMLITAGLDGCVIL